MFPTWKELLLIFVISTSVRLLLLSTTGYHSTDFEVHRNWLAIVASLPLSKWYVDSTSPWTLDYPPFFAYFEKLISFFGSSVDPKMLDVNQLDYDPIDVVLFQRLSVIFSDFLVLIPGCIAMAVVLHQKFQISRFNPISSCLLCCNVGLLLIDHIHFQYNGLLIGVLFFSVSFAVDGRPLLAALFFSILLHLKHIFLYMALPMALFLLQDYCFNTNLSRSSRCITPNSKRRVVLLRFSLLACVFLAVSAVSLTPFIITGQGKRLLMRLFPFGRGLVHSYWAPNVWALYLTADRALAKLVPRSLRTPAVGGSFEGGKKAIEVLPNITPKISLACLIVLGYLPLLYTMVQRGKIYQRRNRGSQSDDAEIVQTRLRLELPLYLSIGNYVAFLLGWHVHEKAILYSTIPLALPVYLFGSYEMKQSYFFLNLWSNFSLLPLLPNPSDSILKLSIWITFSLFDFVMCCRTTKCHSSTRLSTSEQPPFIPSQFSSVSKIIQSHSCKKIQILCMVFLIMFQISWGSIHSHFLSNSNSFEFLPLLLTSCCATVGIALQFGTLVVYYLSEMDEYLLSNSSNKQREE